MTGTGEFYKRDDGHRYMKMKSVDFDPTVGNLKFNAEGLLPEPLLSKFNSFFFWNYLLIFYFIDEAIVEFLNQNWRPIYKTLIPETKAAWEPEIIKLANEFYSRIPIDSVLKED